MSQDGGTPYRRNQELFVAADFIGTNTEKVDKVVDALIELRTTVRLCLATVGFGVPLIIAILAFLVLQSFNTAAKVDRLERLERPTK